MIIRDGVNVQYSHDREALVDWMSGLREFAYVAPESWNLWLDEISDYSVSADYLYAPDENGEPFDFWTERQVAYSYAPRSVKESLIPVELWKPQKAASWLIEEHGFSCLMCATWTRFSECCAPYLPEDCYRSFNARQTVYTRLLCCKACYTAVWRLFDPGNCAAAAAERAITDLFGRVVAGPVRREAA